MNCPRCGSQKTKRELRKEGTGKKAVITNIMDEDCKYCGWYGNHLIVPREPEPEKTEQTPIQLPIL